ncbi:MAG: hypothetical protein GQ532_14950 [Methylomarinum sp.]|nr:hypothetical protein [Methylomarinum sp.]
MNYSKLKVKLLEPGIVALADDEARLSALKNKEIIRYIPIKKGDWKTYLRMNGLWGLLKNSTDSYAVMAYEMLIDPDPTDTEFDMTDVEVRDFIDAVMSQLVTVINGFELHHKTALIKMGEVLESWADQNGYNPLRIGYFAKARAL